MISAMRAKFYRDRPGDFNEYEVTESDLVDDGVSNPMAHSCEFAESYDRLYHDIEVQRGRLEELACFERQVDIRERLRHNKGSRPSCQVDEHVCLAALEEAHAFPPRIHATTLQCAVAMGDTVNGFVRPQLYLLISLSHVL